MIDVRFNALPTWPHGNTWDRRSRYTFKASWSNTLELLDAGGDHADFVAIQAATDPSKRLVYATDCCDFWQHNVRSIALGLEALRAVDRYGISRRGEQYAGFRAALTAGAS